MGAAVDYPGLKSGVLAGLYDDSPHGGTPKTDAGGVGRAMGRLVDVDKACCVSTVSDGGKTSAKAFCKLLLAGGAASGGAGKAAAGAVDL